MTCRLASGAVFDFTTRLAVAADELGYFAISSGSPAVEAIMIEPNLRLAKCDVRGRASGSDQPASAVRISGGPDERAARVALNDKWPRWWRAMLVLRASRGHRLAYFRVTPTAEPTPWLVAQP